MNTVLRILALTTIAALPLYVVRFSLGPLPTTILEILLLLTVIVWGIEKIKNHSAVQPTARTLKVLIGLFLLAATVSIFIAPSMRAALGVWRAFFIEPILFFMIVRDLFSTKRLQPKEIIASLALGALGVSLYAIFQRFTGFGIPHPWNAEWRVTSLFPFPNAVGLFLAPLVPLFIAQAALKRKKIGWMLFFTLVTASSLVAIYFAHSMGAIVGLGGGILIAAIVYVIQTKRWKTLTALVVLIIGLGVGVLQNKSLHDELLLKDWSGTVRKIGWQESVTMLRDYPILGAGLSGFPIALKPYHKATFLEIFQYPHNIVLNFWSEIGLLGLMSFAGLIIYFFYTLSKTLHKRSLHNISLISAMVVILIHGLVDVPYFKNDLAVVFWLIYALRLESN